MCLVEGALLSQISSESSWFRLQRWGGHMDAKKTNSPSCIQLVNICVWLMLQNSDTKKLHFVCSNIAAESEK